MIRRFFATALLALFSPGVLAVTVTVGVQTFALDPGASGSISYTDSGGAGTCSGSCSLTYDDTDTVVLSTSADEGSEFSSWYTTDSSGQPGGPCNGNSAPTCSFSAAELVSSTYTISADFFLISSDVSGVPVASDQTLTVDAGATSYTNSLPAVSNPIGGESYSLISGPQEGAVSIESSSGAFTYTNPAGHSTGVSFSWDVSNSFGTSQIYQTNLLVGEPPPNSPPSIFAESVAQTNEDTELALTAEVSDSDLDEVTLQVSAINGSIANLGSAVSPSGGATSGSTQYQFDYVPETNFNGTDTIVLIAADSRGATSQWDIVVTVNPVNDPPSIADQSFTVNQDSQLVAQIQANDEDGDQLTGFIVSGLSHGALEANLQTGAFTYTPDEGYVGTDTAIVSVSDPSGATAQATITIEVLNVNDAPVAVNDSTLETGENTAVTSGNLLSNDSDADGDLLTITDATAPNGSVAINGDGTVTYTPDTDFVGEDTVTYTVTDGNGGSATAQFTVVVVGVNAAPLMSDQSFAVDENAVLTASVVATDADGDALSFNVTIGVSNGTLTFASDGSFTYTPNTGYVGGDSFTVEVSDGQGGVATAVMTVTVNNVNDAPVAVNDSTLETDENTAVTSGNLLSNDTDADGDSLAITGATALNGSVTLNGDGTVTYTPATDFVGEDTVTYTVEDGNGGSATAQFAVLVVGVNAAPLMSDQSFAVDENAVLTASVVATDADGDALSFNVTIGVSNGTLTFASDGSFTYTPNTGYVGGDSFTVEVSDGQGGVATAVMTVTVNNVNDAPVAVNDAALETGENTVVTSGNLLSNDTDADGDSLTITGATALNGSVTFNGDGTVTYTPATDFVGEDTVTYTVEDGNGGSATAQFVIRVLDVNVAPNANDDTGYVMEAGTTLILDDILRNDTDADGDSLRIVEAVASAGEVTIQGSNSLSFTIPEGAVESTVQIVYTIEDTSGLVDSAAVTIEIIPDNFAPIANDDDPVTITQGDSITIDVLSNDTDADGDILTVVSVSANQGAVIINSDGTLEYTSDSVFTGDDLVTYTIDDGRGARDSATVIVTILPPEIVAVNEPPSANNDPALTTEFETPIFNIDVLSNDSDPEGSVLNVIQASAQYGQVQINSDNTLNYTPASGFSGADVVTYTVSDGEGGRDSADFTVTVAAGAVNSAPRALTDGPFTIGAEEDEITFNVLLNDVDPDGDPIELLNASADDGKLTALPDGTVRYTKPVDFDGSDTVRYTISDGRGGIANGKATITGPASIPNRPPVAQPDGPFSVVEGGRAKDIDVLANDTDADGDLLTLVSVRAVTGTATVSDDNTLDYVAAPGFVGTDTITYEISDGNGGTATSTASITVVAAKAVNTAPVASGATYKVTTDTTLTSLLPQATDAEADSVRYVIAIAAKDGVANVDGNGRFTYKPEAGFVGTDTFFYYVTDGQLNSRNYQVTLNIDGDSDGDGYLDSIDQCVNTDPGSKVDNTGCAIEEAEDFDGDGVSNDDDNCPSTPAGQTVDTNGCSGEQLAEVVEDFRDLEDDLEEVAEVAPVTEEAKNLTATVNTSCNTSISQGVSSGQQSTLSQACQTLKSGENSSEQIKDAVEEINYEEVSALSDNAVAANANQTKAVGNRMQVVNTGGGAGTVSVNGLNIRYGKQAIPTVALQEAVNAILGLAAGEGEEGESFLDFGKLGIFIQGDLDFGDRETEANQTGYESDSWTLTIGGDYRFRDNLYGGLAFNFGETEVQYDTRGDESTIENWGVSLYGGWQITEDWYVDTLISYGNSDYSTLRNIEYALNTGDFQATQRGDTTGTQLSYGINTGYMYSKNGFRFGPVLSFFYSDGTIDGFKEKAVKGSDAWAFDVGEQSIQSTRVSAGLQMDYSWLTDFGVIVPGLRAAYVREKEGSDDTITVRLANGDAFADGSSRFSIQNEKDDEGYYDISVNVSGQFVMGVSGFVSYQFYQDYGGYTREGYSIGIRWDKPF